MNDFVGTTVKELQQFLKQRPVISSGYLKAELLDWNISLLSDREFGYLPTRKENMKKYSASILAATKQL